MSSWKPFPGAQTQALNCPADELFYGGSAGSSKTALLVGAALTRHRRSLILRRESTHLSEVVEQLKRFAPENSHWRSLGAYGGSMTTADNRVIECKGCKDESDKEDYKGRPHDLKAFDELADFLESQYIFINGWNRSNDPAQRCRVIGAGNPPTRGSGDWVVRRWAAWVDPTRGKIAAPGELKWFSTIEGKEREFENGNPFQWKGYTIKPQSRTFIPGKLRDNPILMATDYASRLASLPDALRRAYMEGDFGVCLVDDPWQVIPSHWVIAAQNRWTEKKPDIPLSGAGFDIAYGGSDSTALVFRHGNWISPVHLWKGEDTDSGEKAAQLALPLLLGSQAPVNIDVIGYGSAAFEALKRKGVNVKPINFGASANNQSDRRNVLAFSNMRALCYWCLRDMLDPDLGENLALPPDPELFAELVAPRFELRGGRLYLKPKDEIKEALGRSPDRADAVALACYTAPKQPFAVLSL